LKKNEIEVTVFTPTYNQEKYIEKCIKGIVSQKTNFNFELLISNDNSTDNTQKIIDKYLKKYPNKIRCIKREKNLGSMDNFIQSLNTIHTKYVALCDGDDYWTDTNKLQEQYNILEKNQDCALCFHQTEIFYEDKNCDSIIHPKNIKTKLELDDILKENMVVANSVMYRWKYRNENSLIKEFPKNIVPGDYYLNIMHFALGKGYFINKVMSKYRKQPNGMWYLSSVPDKQNEFYLKYGKKYFNFYISIEKKLNLPKEKLRPQKNWIICKNLQAYTKFRKYWDLKLLFFKEYKNAKDAFENAYIELGFKDKIFYCFSISIFYLIYHVIKSLYKKLKHFK